MQINIGPNYFRKELNEYSNWTWAYIREAMQNCIDAKGSTKINIHTTATEDNKTIITFGNNGEPMDTETITGKLLSLGETGKEFNNTIGGFGKAKILLYFAQESYTIHTGTHLVTGQGGHYTIEEAEHVKGTISTVTINATKEKIDQEIEKFCQYTQWHGTITHNGTPKPTNLTKGYFRKEIKLGRVYTNKELKDKMVIRIGGIPMFIRYCNLPIIIELTGPSSESLTSNRDGIKYEYAEELQRLINKIATEGTRALTAETTTITKWEGPKQYPRPPKSAKQLAYATNEETKAPAFTEALAQTRRQIMTSLGVPSNIQHPKPQYKHSMFVINETTLEIPDIYTPNNFSDYSKRLIAAWSNVMMTIHTIMDNLIPFDVGFIFSETVLAECRIASSNLIYSINPCKIIADKTGVRLKKRYTITKDKYNIISAGIHEYTHIEHKSHDSEFAAALTHNTAAIMKEIKQFHKCFKV